MQMQKKKVIKNIRWSVLSLIALLCIILTLSQLKPVQRAIAQEAVQYLSAKFGTEVKLTDFRWKSFQWLEFKGLLIRDLQQDTLIAAEQFSVHFSPLGLWRNKLVVDDVKLADVLLRIKKDTADTWNFDFVLKAFATDTAVIDTASNTTSWTIQPQALLLQNFRLDYSNAIEASQLSAKSAAVNLRIDLLDLNARQLELTAVDIQQPVLQYLDAASSDPKFINPPDTISPALSFPDLGWNIKLARTQLVGGQVIYKKTKGGLVQEHAFNPSDIAINGLNWDIQQLSIDNSQIGLSIQSLMLVDHAGFQITGFSTDLVFSDSITSLQNFQLHTPNSQIQQSVTLQYPTLEALAFFSKPSSKYTGQDIRLTELITDISIAPEDIRYFFPTILLPTIKEPFSLKGKVSGTLAQLEVEEIAAQQGPKLRFKAKGQLKEPMDLEKLYFDLSVEDAQANYANLKALLPATPLPLGLDQWGFINMSGKFIGKMADFKSYNLQINTQRGPKFQGDFQVTGFPDIQTAQLHLRLDQLSTRLKDWNGFVADPLPIALNNLGEMTVQGTFDGSIYQFETVVQLTSSVGTLSADAHFDFEQEYTNASYQGRLQLQRFDLGLMVQDSLLGKVDMEAIINGSGLQATDWNTDLQLVLNKLTYQQYQYDSLQLKGRLEAAAFTGAIAMNDPNLQFDYTGFIPLGDTLSAYKFELQLDTLNLMPLGFYPSPLGLSAHLTANVLDYRIDSLEGQLVLTNLSVGDSLHKFLADTILLRSSRDVNNIQHLSFRSDLLQMGLDGQYRLSQLPRELGDWMEQDFPIQDLFFPLDSAEMEPELEASIFPLPQKNIKAYLRMGNPSSLASILLPDLKQLDTINLSLLFDHAKSDWEINALVPILHYADYLVDSLRFHSIYEETNFTNILIANHFQFGKNTFISQPYIQTRLKGDSLAFKLRSSEKLDSNAWKIGGQITTTGKELLLSFDPEVRLNGQDWHLQTKKALTYETNQHWEIDQLRLEKGQELIQLDGQGNGTDSSSQLSVVFQQFKIETLSPLLDQPTGYMSGTLNGRIAARNLLTNLNYLANLDVLELKVDSVLLGNIHFQAQQRANQPVIELMAALDGPGNKLRMEGSYNITQQYFDISTNINRLEMKNVDPFLFDLIHDSEGYLSGNFRLLGNPDQPTLKGAIELYQLKTTVDYVNIPYRITAGAITFTADEIDLGEIRMLDANDQQAILSGTIKHQFFNQMAMDLHLNTDRFQFLNTTNKENELFYGKLILQSNIDIKGPLAQPRFFINAKTQTGTQFNVAPLTDEQVISQDDFIIFGQAALDSMGRDTNYLNTIQLAAPGVDVQLNLEMTPDAALQIIIDPLTGDMLVCKGTSNLTVNMDPAGHVSAFGAYQITEGQYTFSYEQWLKREFALLPSSKISFNGDPLRAKLDITAAYPTRVPLTDLVQDQLSDNNISLAGQRVDVQLQMKISGDLIQPVLSFDIVLLNNPQGTIADAARTRLEQLRSDETALNTQVFGLLLFNSFINAAGTRQSVTSAGETVLLSSVSKLISSQLNRIASGLLKGVDINLGVEAYKPGVDPLRNSGITTEVQLGVSKSLLNDRLNVKVGGNLNVGAGAPGQQALTALTGDFALEYLLTPTGNYLLRVYQRSDYDALYEGNVNKTGAGISIRKTFKNKERKLRE